MTTTINADSSNGFKVTADTSSILALQTAGTTAISIDASQAVSFTNQPTYSGGTANGVAYLNGSKVLTTGSALVFDGSNLGLGVTPSAWTFSSLSIGGQAASFAGDVNTVYAQANAYYNAGWKYVGTGYAGQYQIDRSVTALHKWYTAPSGTAGNAITFTQAMTLDASGNLGVGTTSPTVVSNYKSVTVNGTTGGLVDLASNGTVGLRLQCDTTYPGGALFTLTNQPMILGTNGTERARIDSSGNLLVGTTSSAITTAGILLKPAGNSASVPLVGSSGASSSSSEITMAVYSTTAAQYQFYVAYNGQATGRFTYATFSDARLKTNISSIQNGLATITALNPVTFNFLPAKDQTENSDLKYGFIAQEVQQLLPTLVNEGLDKAEDGTPYLTLQTGDLLPIAIKAIQEQQALITTLTDRITALENK